MMKTNYKELDLAQRDQQIETLKQVHQQIQLEMEKNMTKLNKNIDSTPHLREINETYQKYAIEKRHFKTQQKAALRHILKHLASIESDETNKYNIKYDKKMILQAIRNI